MKTLEEQAIEASIKGNWRDAVRLNCEILKTCKQNIEALNRLSFAYVQIGKRTLARQTINNVLQIDKFNQIAKKNSFLIKKVHLPTSNIDFIEEPGITKIIALVDVGEKNSLSKIRSGTKLGMKIRRRRICLSADCVYIGKLPEDLNKNFICLIKKGHTYEFFFKSFDQRRVQVLLRETPRRSKS